MHKNIQSFILIFLLSVFIQTAAHAEDSSVPSGTLKNLFFHALKQSENIAISAESVREAEALYRKTLGESLPEISYERQAFLEQRSKTRHDGFFKIEKTDLTGYRELAQLRSDHSSINQRRHQKRRVEQLLLRDVAVAFYNLLLSQENVSTTEKLRNLANERLGELQERVRIGRTRKTDALGQQVLMAGLDSQLEESQRQVEARRDLLIFLTGIERESLSAADAGFSLPGDSLEYYLNLIEKRPDVEAARENIGFYKGQMEVTRSEFIPSLGFSAAAYTDRSAASDEDVYWDAVFSVEVPLWNWGARMASMDAAGAVLSQSQLQEKAVLRQADLEIRNAYRDYISAKKQLEIRKKSVEFARTEYELQVEDDKQGLVTNLEVFESLDRLNSAELLFNNAVLQEKIAAINLQIAAGMDPSEILR